MSFGLSPCEVAAGPAILSPSFPSVSVRLRLDGRRPYVMPLDRISSVDKPTIFISHTTEESEIALIFKEEVDRIFLGMANVFVSSDSQSIKVGQNWLNEITDGLRNCAAMLIFCSPYSIGRPWINFECGAGWARDIEIAPICHSGLRPVDLPLPISLLQGIEAGNATKIGAVFQLIADKLGAQKPNVDGAAIVARVADFEKRYTEATSIFAHLRKIRSASEEFWQQVWLKVSADVTTPVEGVPENFVNSVAPHFKALQDAELMQWRFGVLGIGFGEVGGGNFGTLTVQISQNLVEATRRFRRRLV